MKVIQGLCYCGTGPFLCAEHVQLHNYYFSPDQAVAFFDNTCEARMMCRTVRKLTYRMEVDGHGVPN